MTLKKIFAKTKQLQLVRIPPPADEMQVNFPFSPWFPKSLPNQVFLKCWLDVNTYVKTAF